MGVDMFLSSQGLRFHDFGIRFTSISKSKNDASSRSSREKVRELRVRERGVRKNEEKETDGVGIIPLKIVLSEIMILPLHKF